MKLTPNIIVQISILFNLTICGHIVYSTFKQKYINPTFRYAYLLSLASIASIAINYLILPIERFFSSNNKSILTCEVLDFSETSHLYVKVFIIAEFIFIVQYIRKRTNDLKLYRFLKNQFFVSMPLYLISVLTNEAFLKFNWIYLFFEMPIVLLSCSYKIVEILHDFNVKDISINPDFIMHFSALFLYGSSLPLALFLSYRLDHTENSLFLYNTISSIVYSIYYMFMIKAIRCSRKTLY